MMNVDTRLAGLGRFCHRFRWLVVGFWLAVLAAAVVFGGALFGRLDSDNGAAPGHESTQGYDLLQDNSRYGERLLVLLDDVPLDDPDFLRDAADAVADTSDVPGVARVIPGFAEGAPETLRARDDRGVLVVVDLAKRLGDENQQEAVDDVRSRFQALARTVPDSSVRIGGQLILNQELGTQTAEDLANGEAVALPISLLILIIIFRGLFAASIPLVGTIATVAATLLGLLGITYLTGLDPNAVTVTTVLGFALSIDYSLLMVSRCREELAVGDDIAAAVARTTDAAGRTVLFSGLTVAGSLASLLCFQSSFYRTLGAAGVSVVLIALAATLTLTPAMLAWLPRRPGRLARRWRRAARSTDDGFFARLARHVQRRPIRYVVVVSALLAATTLPFLRVEFGLGGPEQLPTSFEGRQVADILQDRFPGGGVDPIIVVARADAEQIQSYAVSLNGRAGVRTVGEPQQESLGLFSLEVQPVGKSQGQQAQHLLRDLRADEPGFPTWVTGNVAFLVDLKDELADRGPLALTVIVLSALVLLFLMTGSVLIPLKALVMNTLSLGASFGALVLVFQDGHLQDVLGFTAAGSLEVWVPVLVFVFAFGLSMDYEVFMLSRIREQHLAGVDNNRAVELGLQRSGRIITSAALLIIVVFAGFAAGKLLGIKALGLAMSIAVLVDATLVRCLLVPATMTLLGRANWWAPGPLRRLHDRFGLREAPDVEGATSERHAVTVGGPAQP